MGYYIKPARGIRQGCPLSPYLFVLCMEWQGHLIHSTISNGKWKPIQLSPDGPHISYLFFSDDLVIFSRADLVHGRPIKDILANFCEFSGHKINGRKTNIFFSKGVDESLANSISSSFGFEKLKN